MLPSRFAFGQAGTACSKAALIGRILLGFLSPLRRFPYGFGLITAGLLAPLSAPTGASVPRL